MYAAPLAHSAGHGVTELLRLPRFDGQGDGWIRLFAWSFRGNGFRSRLGFGSRVRNAAGAVVPGDVLTTARLAPVRVGQALVSVSSPLSEE